MNIPDSVLDSTAQGNILKPLLDSADVGERPDASELPNLRAVLTATIPVLVHATGMLVMEPLTLHTNQVGDVINPGAPDTPVRIPATDQPGMQFRYLVELVWDGQSAWHRDALRWHVQAPAGGVLNLSAMVDDPQDGVGQQWVVAADEADLPAESTAGAYALVMSTGDVKEWR